MILLAKAIFLSLRTGQLLSDVFAHRRHSLQMHQVIVSSLRQSLNSHLLTHIKPLMQE